MTDDDTRRDDAQKSPPGRKKPAPPPPPAAAPAPDAAQAADDYNPDDDPYIQALRDIPRMRNIATEKDTKGRVYEPPPPTMARVGGMLQGCGGVLLTLLGGLMVLSALWFGFYVWGPALLLAGGLMLVLGTSGVWAGRFAPLSIAIGVIVVMAGVAYFWSSYIPAAAALSPIGQFGMIIAPGSMMVALVLVMALVVHVATLFSWKRLKPPTRRQVLAWAILVPGLIIAALVLHFTQNYQRASWLDDRLDEWGGAPVAANSDPVTLGVNANITLGYSFLTADEGDDSNLDVRLAELDAILDTGAPIVRLSVGGDMLLEADTPRMFKVDEDPDAKNANTAEDNADRQARQLADETVFMTRLDDAGVDLLFSDSQYTPYMLVWANDDKDAVQWDDFTRLHENRIRHYAAAYHPARYTIVNEPDAYKQYSAVKDPDSSSGSDSSDNSDADYLDAWVAHTENLIAAVKEESPDTLVGVAIALQSDSDLDYYERVLSLDGLDYVGFRLFQAAAFDRLEEILDEYGHPNEFGKELWIMETWYGYCLAPQRSMTLDSKWLEVVTAFAAQNGVSGVLTADFGCFVQAGGTLFQEYEAASDDRTAVWETWRDLIQAGGQ